MKALFFLSKLITKYAISLLDMYKKKTKKGKDASSKYDWWVLAYSKNLFVDTEISLLFQLIEK